MAGGKTPGLQYAAVDGSGPVFDHASGWADLARRVPMTLDTTLMAYSMSKTITAVAVLQLAQARTIGLEDPLDKYGPHPYGPEVTIGQLLSHTAGIPNPLPLRWVHSADRHAAFDEAAALAEVVRRHPRPAARPGARYAYSNIGYWLLGGVVATASGIPFTTYVSARVLGPLAVSPGELGYSIIDPARHAIGYLEKYSFFNLAKRFLIDRALIGTYAGPWLSIRSHCVNGAAFGGLVGTARGFGRFLQDQLRPATTSVLLRDAGREWLTTQQHTRTGTPVAMTLGWHIDDTAGTRCFFKEGGGGGFHCMMRLYPGSRVGTILMTNATGGDIAKVQRTLDRELLSASA